MDVNQAIFNRTSIRAFRDDPVSEQDIQAMIEAAVYAPSASNKQAWKFLVIDDDGIKEKICLRNGGISKNGGTRLILGAPKGILVLYRNDVSRNYVMYKDTIQTAAAAIQNMLLTAYDRGLGTCWICKLPHPKYVRKLLDIPSCYDVIAYVAVGYPKTYLAEHTLWHYGGDEGKALARKRKYSLDEFICHNRFTAHNNQKGVLKHPKILYRMHWLQMYIHTDSSSWFSQKLFKSIYKLFEGTY